MTDKGIALKFSDTEIKEALLEAHGNLTEAAKHLVRTTQKSCTRQYIKNRVDSSAMLLELWEGMREEIVDQAEGNIFQAVQDGDYQASVLVVRTLGKERGWVPKEEVNARVSATELVGAIQAGRERARLASPDPSGQADVTE